MTAGSYGEFTRTKLLQNGQYTIFAGDGSKPGILKTDEVMFAKELKTKEELISYLTPSFQALCDEIAPLGMTIINTENTLWSGGLENCMPTGNLKPDLAVIHRAMVHFEGLPGAENHGRPVPEVIDTLRVLCKAQLKLDDKGFGEICSSTEMVARSFEYTLRKVSTVRGIAFDSSKFILVESNQADAVRAVEGMLDAPGSLELVREFFSREDPLTRSFVLMCDALGVKEYPSDWPGGGARSCLGRGRYGGAFIVKGLTGPEDEKPHVLKIAVSEGSTQKDTRYQFDCMMGSYEDLPNHVVRVKEGSFTYGYFKIASVNYGYSGYLIEDVGVPMPQQSDLTQEVCAEICRSLNALHLNGIYHGDPHYGNVVLCDGQYKWIDFGMVCSGIKEKVIIYDAKCLIESFFRPNPVKWEGFLGDLLETYAASLDVECMLAIVQHIRAHMSHTERENHVDEDSTACR
jgi:hypothetical protein